MIAERMLENVLGLPPADRAALIEKLFQSFAAPAAADSDSDAAWRGEVEARFSAYDSGRLAASPADEVLERLGAR
jgi:putative addiction module component (TIGR02574 family)